MNQARVSEVVNEKWNTYLSNVQPGEKMKKKMHFTQAVARQMLREASDEEQDAVKQRQQDVGLVHLVQPEDEEQERKQKAAGFAKYGINLLCFETFLANERSRAIDCLPHTFQIAGRNIEEQTNWKVSFWAGGPNPTTGELQMIR